MALVGGGYSVAQACGMFRSVRLSPEERPTMSREKVLLIHDAEKGEQHFIREVAFARAGDPLGFVVPTPSRPTVAEVETTPFTQLRNSFSFLPVIGIGGGSGSESGYGRGSGAGFGGRGVTVLEETKVGSFKTYVLAATDEQALATWLSDNDLVASEGAEAWLEHYVRMGFYYVAMRYDPPRKKRRKKKGEQEHPTAAETIRISFATPVPYYPYLEPVEPKLPTDAPRLLEVWTVGTEKVVPVGLKSEGSDHQWVRPLRAGESYSEARAGLEFALRHELEALLPEGRLVVQSFQDQKRSRDGFGDVLFVPAAKGALDQDRIAKLEPLLGILDPSLVPAKAEVPE